MHRNRVNKIYGQTKTQWHLPLRLGIVTYGVSCYQVFSARTRAFSLLLVRAALFLWIRPLLTMVSIFGTAALNKLAASSPLPWSTALSTALMAVRMRERSATLCWRRFSPWRARFADCLLFATNTSSESGVRAQAPARRAFWAFAPLMSIETGTWRGRPAPGPALSAGLLPAIIARLAPQCAIDGCAGGSAA